MATRREFSFRGLAAVEGARPFGLGALGLVTNTLPLRASPMQLYRTGQVLPGTDQVLNVVAEPYAGTEMGQSKSASTARGMPWPWIALGAVGVVGAAVIVWRARRNA